MSAETGSIGMEAMAFTAPAIEVISAPAISSEINFGSIPSIGSEMPTSMDISSPIHPYSGATENMDSLIDKSAFESFPKPFESLMDAKSSFPSAEPDFFSLNAPVSPMLQASQGIFGAESISIAPAEIPSVFYEAFHEPSIPQEIYSSELGIGAEIPVISSTPTTTELEATPILDSFVQNLEPQGEIDTVMDAIKSNDLDTYLEISDISTRAENASEAVGFLEISPELAQQEAVSVFGQELAEKGLAEAIETEVEAQLVTETQTQTETSTKPKTAVAQNMETAIGDELPPQASKDLYVIDTSANSERLEDAKFAVNKVFGVEDQLEVVGTQITSIMGATPELDEISEILKTDTRSLEDGSYKAVIEDLAEERFKTREEALKAIADLLRKKPAVTVSTHGIPVADEDVQRVESRGKPSRESVIFEGK